MTASDALGVTLLTLRVGVTATAAIALPAIATGWLLSRWRSRLRPLVQTLVSLPMVLPPVAVGLLLLLLLARHSPVGRAIESLFGAPILLTWWAAALASAVMSFPLFVLGATQGFDAVPRRLEQVAASLGASPLRVLWSITLPHAASGILYGVVAAFARSLGEFGATSLVAGRIHGETETLSLAIYAHIEEFDHHDAILLAAISLGLALATIGSAELLLRRRR
jgi:molybdate transport system permease protein